MKRVFIDDDDFVWHILTEIEACYYVDCGLPVHVIVDGEDEPRQTKSKIEIERHIRHHGMVATPVGFINDAMN